MKTYEQFILEIRKVEEGKHPGFDAVADEIASKDDVSKGDADAILASATRKAKHNKADVTKNPRLKRVKG